MAGDSEGGAEGGGANRRSVPDGVLPGGTLLESEAVQRPSQAPWRPSRPPMTGEYAALAATGVRTGRSARPARGRWWLLVMGVALLAGAGAWWIRSATDASSDPGLRGPSERQRSAVEVGKLAPGANGTSVPPDPEAEPPAEPRVAPIVARPPGGASAAGSSPARPRAEVFSLKPLPRGKPGTSSSGATPDRAARASGASDPAPSGGAYRTSDPRDELPSPPRAAGHGRSVESAPEDPWNPNSFGDRR
jgi:hypothetical protein